MFHHRTSKRPQTSSKIGDNDAGNPSAQSVERGRFRGRRRPEFDRQTRKSGTQPIPAPFLYREPHHQGGGSRTEPEDDSRDLTALIPRAIKLHFGDRGARSIGNEAVTVCVDANENAAFVDFV